MQEAQVRSLGQEDSPGEGNGNPLQYSCLENPIEEGPGGAIVHGTAKEPDMTERLSKEGRRGEVFSGPWRAGALSLAVSIDSRFFLCIQKVPVSETLTFVPL